MVSEKKKSTMELVLNDILEIGAHVRRNRVFKGILFLRKDPVSFMLAQHVLSYLLK